MKKSSTSREDVTIECSLPKAKVSKEGQRKRNADKYKNVTGRGEQERQMTGFFSARCGAMKTCFGKMVAVLRQSI